VTVVALGAVRSCGVTTLGVALAGTWPAERRVLLAELDPAGGTLAAAAGWPPDPGLVSLAAAARRGTDPNLVWGHCQILPGGVAVLTGPASSDQARGALSMLPGLFARLGELEADVIVDCGRLTTESPTIAVVDGADWVILAVRPRLADLHALSVWLETHPVDINRLGVVLIGDGPYPDGEVADALGAEVLARLPWDPDTATALPLLPTSARQLTRTPLVRAIRTLAAGLAERPGAPEAAVQDDAPVLSLEVPRARAWRPRRNEPVPSRAASNGTEPDGVQR
jgi:MinD-like ATPase involved in chromosome partitioning or flagellar assembly